MSYTMTLDMPQKEASYFARHSAQFQSELSAIALVIVQSRMNLDKDVPSKMDFVADWGKLRIKEGELDLSRPTESLRDVDLG